jgi:hypothetical protein
MTDRRKRAHRPRYMQNGTVRETLLAYAHCIEWRLRSRRSSNASISLSLLAYVYLLQDPTFLSVSLLFLRLIDCLIGLLD